MKNLLKLFAVTLLTISAVTVTNAQTLKFGHIDMQALIQVMPERATAEEEFNKFQADIEEIYGEMQKSLEQKYAEFQQMGEDVSEIKRNAKAEEIQDVQARLQNYSQTAQQQLQQKQNDVMQPIIEKAQNTVEEVAKEQGLIYVFQTTALLYKSNQSVDLLPLVKAKLGIQ